MINVYNWSTDPVTAEVHKMSFDEEGNETGLVLVSPASEEIVGLTVSKTATKSHTQVIGTINSGKSLVKIDRAITAHLPELDITTKQLDAWHEKQVLVETLDQEAEGTPILNEDDLQIGAEPTPWEVALEERDALEIANPWLSGFRGEEADERPAFEMTVDDWKTNNASSYNKYLKTKGIEVSGKFISLNESNQHGLADISVMIDKAISLGTDPFPMNLNMESATGIAVITVTTQLEFDTAFLAFGLARQQFFV